MMKTGNSFSHAQLLHMLSQLTRDPEQSQEVCNVHQRQVVKKHDFSQIDMSNVMHPPCPTIIRSPTHFLPRGHFLCVLRQSVLLSFHLSKKQVIYKIDKSSSKWVLHTS